jgi:serine/threonine-protein kinase
MTDTASEARWRLAHEIVDAALDLEPAERDAWVDVRCGPDSELAAAVRLWLSGCERDDGRLERAPRLPGDDATPAALALVGRHLGPWRLLRVAGGGGMGTVYEAMRDDGEFSQRGAAKVIHPVLGWDERLRSRFAAERQILASLEHPHIARLLDGGVSTFGLPYYVMEFVEGTRVDQWARERHGEARACVGLFRQVCDAVRFAHARLIVHRDLKPSNVLVTARGDAKLLDFGIAKLLDPGGDDGIRTQVPALSAMTPEYASPEQRSGGVVTVQSDVYSLGVVLHEMLTGARPIEGRRIATADADLGAVLRRALEADPALRYPSVEAFDADLARWQRGLPVDARRGGTTYRIRKFVRRHRAAVAAGTLVAGLLVAFAAGTVTKNRRIAIERDRAEAVSSYLLNLFRAPYSFDSADGSAPFRTMLDSGVTQLDAALPGQPTARATLFAAIADGYLGMGILEPALASSRRALAAEQQAGSDDSTLAVRYYQVGAIALQAGRLDDAAAMFDTAIVLEQRHWGDASYQVAMMRTARASVDLRNGHADRALVTLRGSVAILRDHPGIGLANALSHLGHALLGAGDAVAAERAYRESGALRRQIGASRKEQLDADEGEARALIALGRLAEADSLLTGALEEKRALMGDANIEIAYTLGVVAELREHQGRLAEALALRRDVLQRLLRVLPDSDWRVQAHRDAATRLASRLGTSEPGE